MSEREQRLGAFFEFRDGVDRFFELIVLADDRGGAGHVLAELLVNEVRVLVAAGAVEQGVVVGLGLVAGGADEAGEFFVGGRFLERAEEVLDAGADPEAGEDAGEQRVRAEAVGAVVLVVALADGVQAGDVGLMVARRAGDESAFGRAFVVGPQSAHRVVDGGEDLHRLVARVDALEFLVDAEDAAELAVELFARDVREVEVDAGPFALDAETFVDADVEDLAGGDVARHEVAVLRVALFEEVVALGFGDALGRARDLAACAGPRRGRLRRGPIRSSGGACRSRGSRWGGPG